ncbi:hypothetical protein GGR28_003506 [Lewinella aquimaris]|uniref:Uncharacterized protein n=1 Tax=Neolewinella aquimaris TaxID=1835722 RepID=A0A840EBP3_9BACT|nr:hypothetical protein [Neolewinella aquimaris]MBB4080867.1 hypothetical protein [Neolewinella aquimaris]
MLNSLRAVPLLAFLCLLGCSSSGEGSEAESSGARTVTIDPDNGNEAMENTLALEPGLYVIDGSECDNPVATDARVWTGRGLETSTTQGCTFEVTSHEGMVYHGRQSCATASDGASTTTELSIEVLEPGSIVLTEAGETMHLTLCPDGEVPEWVTEKLTVE